MPRCPDPKSKTPQLTVRAINDKDVEDFRKLKEICAEKGITIASVLRPWLEAYLKEHWPPNPQLQMAQFTGRLPLSLETKRKLELSRNQTMENCLSCSGSGKGELGQICPSCQGDCQVVVTHV